MAKPDLNLLYTLDVLLSEGSVAGASRRLGLSPSAMSRSLARLRETTGDPLLVRAGRGLVPTPRALELRERVRLLVQEAEAALRPTALPDLGQVHRMFTLRSSEGFAENFGARILERLRREAPGVRLRFVQKLDRDSRALREGSVDLETGVLGEEIGPEVRAQALFRDRFIGVVRAGHLLCGEAISLERFAACEHVLAARRGAGHGPVEAALQRAGQEQNIVMIVGGFASALALARTSDLVASVPERHTGVLRTGMHSFPLPFQVEEFTVSLLWHPRLDADPVHRWLRSCIREICTASDAAEAGR